MCSVCSLSGHFSEEERLKGDSRRCELCALDSTCLPVALTAEPEKIAACPTEMVDSPAQIVECPDEVFAEQEAHAVVQESEEPSSRTGLKSPEDFSVRVTDFEPSDHPDWVTSTYYVPSGLVKEICENLGFEWDEIQGITRDAFATGGNERFPKYYQKNCSGSKGDGSFDMDWSQKTNPLLWINAPFEHMDRVVEKICHDRAKAIVVAPCWDEKAPWLQRLDAISESCFEVPRSWKLFTNHKGVALPQQWWKTRVYLVDGNWDEVFGLSDEEESEDEEDSPRTASKHRLRGVGYIKHDRRYPVLSDSEEVVADMHRDLKHYGYAEPRRIRSVTTAFTKESQDAEVHAAIERVKKRFGGTSL